jgi:hypothetical protein
MTTFQSGNLLSRDGVTVHRFGNDDGIYRSLVTDPEVQGAILDATGFSE